MNDNRSKTLGRLLRKAQMEYGVFPLFPIADRGHFRHFKTELPDFAPNR